MSSCCLFFYLIAAVIGCIPDAAPSQGSQVQGMPELKLEAQFEPGCAHLDTPIAFSAVLRNKSEQIFWIMSTVPEITYKLRVIDREGKDVSMTELANGSRSSFARNMGINTSTLKPGDSHKETIVLSDVFAISVPGTYRVEASRRCYLDKYDPNITGPLTFMKTARFVECKAEPVVFCVGER